MLLYNAIGQWKYDFIVLQKEFQQPKPDDTEHTSVFVYKYIRSLILVDEHTIKQVAVIIMRSSYVKKWEDI